VIVATFAISTVKRSLLTPHASYETATWREEMNDEEGIARARWREERRERCMMEGGEGNCHQGRVGNVFFYQTTWCKGRFSDC
jgi:hypothetical protein